MKKKKKLSHADTGTRFLVGMRWCVRACVRTHMRLLLLFLLLFVVVVSLFSDAQFFNA